MTRLRWIWLALILAPLGGAPAHAEWTAEGTTARDPGQTLSVTCGEGTVPFTAIIQISGRLVPTTNSDRRTFTIFLDDQGYRFAPSVFDPGTDSWPLPVSMTDPLTLDLFQTGRLVLDDGSGKAWEYRTEGLDAALSQTLGACIDGWRAAGHAVPAALKQLGSGAPTAPAGLPASIGTHIANACGGGYTLDQANLVSGLIDADDQPDYVLHWDLVRCSSGMARPFCGAANCSIEVFLSSFGYRLRDSDIYLGTSVGLVPLSNGRMGISFGGTWSLCSSGFCDRPFWWDGTQLRQ